jgi:prepilin peptidase CpaA
MTISAFAATAGVILFPLAMVYAGLMDLFTMKIRNILVLALGAGWLVLAPLAGFSPGEMGTSAAVAAVVFLLAFASFALGWIGGGDAKLATAAALWLDPEQVLIFFLYAGVLGGLLTLGILQLRTHLLPPALWRVAWIAQLRDPQSGVPYGAAMAPAALLVFPDSAWLAHAAFF